MSSRAHSPAPAPARVLAQARFEAGTLLRNGEQLLVTLAFPLLALAALAMTSSPGLGPGRRIDLAVPGVLALAVVSTAFTGQAISTGFDRRHGVLRYLGVTPLGRAGLLAGKTLAVLGVQVLQFAVIGAVALALGWSPSPAGLLAALPSWLAGSWAFAALGLLLAGTMRAEAVLALANLIWAVLLGAGGLLFPAALLPAPVAAAVRWLPSSALGDGLRAALTGAGADAGALALLLTWALAATAVTARAFRWSQ